MMGGGLEKIISDFIKKILPTTRRIYALFGAGVRLSLAFASWEVGREKREGERVVE
jgi:hypothetical protein